MENGCYGYSVGRQTEFDYLEKHSNVENMSLPDVSRWLPRKLGLGTTRQTSMVGSLDLNMKHYHQPWFQNERQNKKDAVWLASTEPVRML